MDFPVYLGENLIKEKEQDFSLFLFKYARESDFTSVYLGVPEIYLQVRLAKFVVFVIFVVGFHSLLRS